MIYTKLTNQGARGGLSRRCNQIKHFTLSVVRVLTLRPSQVTGEYLRDEFQVNPNYFANSQISSLCAGCDSDTLSGDLCFPKSWRVADFNKECHFNINILCPQKSRIARMKGLLVMQHIPCRLILTVCNPASVPRWNLSRARPRGIKLQSEFSPYSPRQACSDPSLDFKPQTGPETMKLQSPDNSPNSCHQSVAARVSSPQSWRDITEYFCWQTANCFPLYCHYCSTTLKRRHEYWLSGRKIAKLAPKNPSRGEGKINCESGNSGELCGAGCVCNYKTENPPRD